MIDPEKFEEAETELFFSRKLGETADLAQDEGEDTNVVSFVAGLKIWL